MPIAITNLNNCLRHSWGVIAVHVSCAMGLLLELLDVPKCQAV